MYIKGIGTVSRAEVSSVLTREALKAIELGDITWIEAGEMYKVHLIKKHSAVGGCADTFSANYKRIPDKLKTELSP